MIPHADMHVEDFGQVGAARRAAMQIATAHDIDETTRGRIAVITNELGANLVRHARAGCLLIGCHSSEDGCQLEVIAIDSGPGMTDVNRHLRDGSASGEMAGTGLGTVRRLSSDFSAYSIPGRGSVLMARVWRPAMGRASAQSPRQRFAHVGICFAPAGRPVSAHGWDIDIDDAHGRARVIVVAGVHDHSAASAERIRQAFCAVSAEPATALDELHGQFDGTAGASVAIVDADARTGLLRVAGVGDVAGRLVGHGVETPLPTAAGRLGVAMARAAQAAFGWAPDTAVVLHSAGLRPSWSLADAPGLLQCDPAVIAGWLIRDYGIADVDLSLVILKRA